MSLNTSMFFDTVKLWSLSFCALIVTEKTDSRMADNNNILFILFRWISL